MFQQAQDVEKLRPDADPYGLSLVVMSCVEGALLMCKASKDIASFQATASVLKGMIEGQRVP